MEFWILAGRLLLAAIMGMAGIGKLADLTDSRQAMQNFGVPASLAPLLGQAVPIAELFAAIILLTPLAWWGALLALLLLLTFSAAILLNLLQGKTPDCHCFGQLYSAPIGWPTLLRNLIFSLLALWLFLQGEAKLASNGTALPIAISLLIWGALPLAALGGWWLFNQIQKSQQQLAQPAQQLAQSSLFIGSPAPSFRLSGLYGETLTMASLLAEQKPILLLFIDPTCNSCNELLPEIQQWQQQHGDQFTLVPISRGEIETNRTGKHGLQNVLLQKKAEVSSAYHIERMPSAVLLHPNGTIASAIASGADAIRAQVARFTQPFASDTSQRDTSQRDISQRDTEPQHSAGDDYCKNGVDNSKALHAIAQRGEVAPDFILPDIEGDPLGLDPFRGHPILLLFWDASCEHCSQMLDEIKAVEEDRPLHAPQILVIATGTAEMNRVQALRSPVMLDSDLRVTRRYGVIGTPSALLIDSNGRIASDIALGRQAMRTLLA